MSLFYDLKFQLYCRPPISKILSKNCNFEVNEFRYLSTCRSYHHFFFFFAAAATKPLFCSSVHLSNQPSSSVRFFVCFNFASSLCTCFEQWLKDNLTQALGRLTRGVIYQYSWFTPISLSLSLFFSFTGPPTLTPCLTFPHTLFSARCRERDIISPSA